MSFTPLFASRQIYFAHANFKFPVQIFAPASPPFARSSPQARAREFTRGFSTIQLKTSRTRIIPSRTRIFQRVLGLLLISLRARELLLASRQLQTILPIFLTCFPTFLFLACGTRYLLKNLYFSVTCSSFIFTNTPFYLEKCLGL
jgi:hypothetical protein